MKKLMLMAALAVAMMAGQAWAGGGCGGCPSGAKKKSSDCSSYLSGIELTSEQKEKIAEIEAQCKAQGSTPEACKSSMSAIRELLTDDQRAAFDAASSKSSKKQGCGS